MGMAKSNYRPVGIGLAEAIVCTATNTNYGGSQGMKARANGLPSGAGRIEGNRESRRNSVKPKMWYREFEKGRV